MASIFTRLLDGEAVSWRALVAACDVVGGGLDLPLITTVDGGVKLRPSKCSRKTMTRLHLLAVLESPNEHVADEGCDQKAKSKP